MKLPSEAEIDEAKKAAASAGRMAVLLTYDDPDVDAAVIVATMTAKDWATYADIASRDAGDAHSAAFVEHTMWPADAEASALGEATPALHDLVADDLRAMAGGGREHERIRLSEGMRAADLLRFGLTPAKVDALLAEYKGAKLFAVRIAGDPSICFVAKTPIKPVYRSVVETYQRAMGLHAGIHDAATQAARDMIVHSTPALDEIERQCPAVMTNNMVTIFIDIGGAGAKAQRRRL